MYSNISDEEDNKIAERWQKDAEGIIIFVRPGSLSTSVHTDWTDKQNGLFSAVVAALVVLSAQDLKPNSQDTSAFYLERIYQLQADPSLPRLSTPSSVARPPTFFPPEYVLWVNSLWFLSLVISLTCAMLATLLQQWVRRYIRITQPARCNPEKRARMRAFFANGFNDFHVAWVVEALPALVHLSLFLFFAGLLIYLFHTNHTVFSAVACWVAILLAAYGGFTVMPIIRHNSPYYAPLSPIAWFLYASILHVVLEVRFIMRLRLSTFNTHHLVRRLKRLPRQWILGGVEGAAEEGVSQRSSLIKSILNWTIDSLDEDDSLEKFFEFIPGFYKSEVVKDLQQSPTEEVQSKILGALIGFLDRTLSSNSLSEFLTIHRLTICLNAAGELQSLAGLQCMYYNVFQYAKWHKVPHAVAIGRFLRSWDKTSDGRLPLCTQAICARIIASAEEHNDRWIALATDHLGIPKGALEYYLVHGDSVQLANLIHFTRQLSLSDWELFGTLRRLSGFDVRNTLPGLQREFCALWNEVVGEAQEGGPFNGAAQALSYIRPIHIALHRSPDSVSTTFSTSSGSSDDSSSHPVSYSLCDIADRRSDSMYHVDKLSASEASCSPAVPSATFQHQYDTLHPTDEPPTVHTPASTITRPTSQVFTTNPTGPLYSTTAITEQGTTIRSTLSIPSIAGSDHGSTLAITVSIPQSAFPTLSTGTSSTQRIADHRPVSPSMAPGTPILSSSISSPSNTNLRSSSTCVTTQLDEFSRGLGLPTPISCTTPCHTAQQEFSSTHDHSRPPGIPIPVVAHRNPNTSTQLVSDVAGEPSSRPPDAAPSFHNFGHSRQK
jgi:hypothetical protein